MMSGGLAPRLFLALRRLVAGVPLPTQLLDHVAKRPARKYQETRERIQEALRAPGRPGVRKIAEQFGVNASTVQQISRGV